MKSSKSDVTRERTLTADDRRPRVLLVDDDERNLLALSEILEPIATIVTATNGKMALRELLRGDFAVILLDVFMPEMDGYETTRAIREMDRFRTLPIIAVTAKAMKGDREKTLAAGASDYITKPVDTEQLLSLMRVWLYQ